MDIMHRNAGRTRMLCLFLAFCSMLSCPIACVRLSDIVRNWLVSPLFGNDHLPSVIAS